MTGVQTCALPIFIAATPAEQEPAPSYIPPPNPFHTGWINTPGQAPQFYNYNDSTGTGTLYSPGTANPFTTITGN